MTACHQIHLKMWYHNNKGIVGNVLAYLEVNRRQTYDVNFCEFLSYLTINLGANNSSILYI